MRTFIFLCLLLTYPLVVVAQQDNDELGRAMANYQACGQAALQFNDQAMFVYYQQMFNDSRLSTLAFDDASAEQVYRAWAASEKALQRIASKHLHKLCLSRFDDLSRQMINKGKSQ